MALTNARSGGLVVYVTAAILGCTLLGGSPLSGQSQGSAERVPSKPALDASQKSRLIQAFGKFPMRFETNRGQTDGRVEFMSRGKGYTLFLAGKEAVLSLTQPSADGNSKLGTGNSKLENPRVPAVLRMKLAGASVAAKAVGIEPLASKSNYFLGDDPRKWRRNVPNYSKVKYQDVYPGIDLLYYGNQQQLEYDFVLAPGADPKAIAFEIVGEGSALPPSQHTVQGPRAAEGRPYIDPSGDLVVSAGEGAEARFHKPLIYQTVDGKRQEIEGRYTLRTVNPKSKIQNMKSLSNSPPTTPPSPSSSTRC